MPSELMIQQVMDEFRRVSRPARENLLAALAAGKATLKTEDMAAIMDPEWARRLQPILSDELGRDALFEALVRLSKEDGKTSGWRKFFGGR